MLVRVLKVSLVNMACYDLIHKFRPKRHAVPGVLRRRLGSWLFLQVVHVCMHKCHIGFSFGSHSGLQSTPYSAFNTDFMHAQGKREGVTRRRAAQSSEVVCTAFV